MQTLKQLKTGELKGVKRLTLRENLTEFPLEILSLSDTLEILDLSDNQLSDFPNEIEQLSKLKILFASNNKFSRVPTSIGLCPNLEMVGFKSNRIVEVPADSLPKQLRWLILTDNKIVELPETIGLRLRLQKLALAGNQLTSLPLSMANLLNLELLRISANQLDSCPDHILSLPKLAWFAFAGNPFSQNKEKMASVPRFSKKDVALKQVLGQGASGVISSAQWLNNDHQLEEDIAVKVFKGGITSDGYPQDELDACLKVSGGQQNNLQACHYLIRSLALIEDDNFLALVMNRIPTHFKNLGNPPNFATCTRDTFHEGLTFSRHQVDLIVKQMVMVFEHLHQNKVCHGDLYAHNTLIDQDCNIIFGDFGAASMYHMLDETQQQYIRKIESRALEYFKDDLKSLII